MNRNNNLVLIVFSILLFTICSNSVLSIGIGVSPGGLDFKNVLKNGYAEKIMYVSITETDFTKVSYELSGDIVNWTTTDQENNSFVVDPNVPFPLKVIIQPPEDIANGVYQGHIRFLSDKLDTLSGGSGSAVKAGIMFNINVEIVGNEIVACRIPQFSLSNIERGEEIESQYLLKNDGNVRVSPYVEIVIWDQFQENIVEILSFNMDETLPTTELRGFAFLNQSLDLGQYWADVYVDECNYNNLFTINVYDKGEIHDSGVLTSIENVPAGVKNEIIPINAFFTNTGQRSVDAKFKGRIELNDNIIALIETDTLRVNPGQTESLTYYFTPETEGVYNVFGRVHYNNKITFEKQGVLNIYPELKQPHFPELNIGLLILYLIIIGLIIFFIKKIVKEKKKKK